MITMDQFIRCYKWLMSTLALMENGAGAVSVPRSGLPSPVHSGLTSPAKSIDVSVNGGH